MAARIKKGRKGIRVSFRLGNPASEQPKYLFRGYGGSRANPKMTTLQPIFTSDVKSHVCTSECRDERVDEGVASMKLKFWRKKKAKQAPPKGWSPTPPRAALMA